VDAVGIGVQKSATSWLFRRLEQHPEVGTADREGGSSKELNFFNHHYHRGLDWYESLFSQDGGINLEFSVLYFPSSDAPERLASYNPEARLILSLRDPVDRAWSQHRHEYAHGRTEHPRDFARALERNPTYLEQGRYGSLLERWLRHFELDRIHIVDYERIRTQPAEVLRETFEFLGVDPDFEPTGLQERTYVSTVPGDAGQGRFRQAASRWLRRTLGGELHARIRGISAVRSLGRTEAREITPSELPPPPQELLEELRDGFESEMRHLESLTGLSFPHWRSPGPGESKLRYGS
jgi:hypothetical protein